MPSLGVQCPVGLLCHKPALVGVLDIRFRITKSSFNYPIPSGLFLLIPRVGWLYPAFYPLPGQRSLLQNPPDALYAYGFYYTLVPGYGAGVLKSPDPALDAKLRGFVT